MLNEKTIFITGATGSIGRVLARRLSAMGTHLRLLVRDPDRAQDLKALPNVELIKGDLGDPASLQGTMDGCAVVYHSAAKLLGSDESAFHQVNVVGTEALGKEAVRAKVQRFVHISTVAVYGYPSEHNVREDHPWRTLGRYNTTKQQAEQVLQSLAKTQNLPLVIARPGNVVGPEQYGWTVQPIQRIKQGLLLTPRRQDSGMHDPIYIDNLIDALILLGEHPETIGGAFNIVDGTPMLMSDYIAYLTRLLKRPVIVVPGWVMKGSASLLEALQRPFKSDTELTREAVGYLFYKTTFSANRLRGLGWTPAVSKDEADRRTEEWLRQEGLIPA